VVLATLALVASLALTPPSPPAPLEGDAASLARAHVAHASPATLHTVRAARLASPSAALALPPPATIHPALRTWTMQRRADAASAQLVRERDLRSQAPRAPPPRRS
jgi:hypothetical protein